MKPKLTKSTDKSGVVVWTVETLEGYYILGPVNEITEAEARKKMKAMSEKI